MDRLRHPSGRPHLVANEQRTEERGKESTHDDEKKIILDGILRPVPDCRDPELRGNQGDTESRAKSRGYPISVLSLGSRADGRGGAPADHSDPCGAADGTHSDSSTPQADARSRSGPCAPSSCGGPGTRTHSCTGPNTRTETRPRACPGQACGGPEGFGGGFQF